MSSPTTTFAIRVLDALQTMDAEATYLVGGRAAGLQAYRHPALASNRWEESWSRGIADRVPQCRVECCYPGAKKRCDLVWTLEDGSKLWLEVKGAWKQYLWNGVLKSNSAYRKHLKAAAADVIKVGELPRGIAQHVGLLLLGFDVSGSPMDADIEAFILKAKLKNPEWTVAHRRWADPLAPGHRNSAWLWIRDVQ